MEIHIRTATGMIGSGRYFTLNNIYVGSMDVDAVKSLIESESGIPAKFQKLLFRGKVLGDELLLNIRGDSCVMHLAPNGPEAFKAFASCSAQQLPVHPTLPINQMTVIVKLLTHHTRRYHIHPHATVSDLKEMHHIEDGPPPEMIDFVHNNTCLREGYALMDYNIRHESTIHVIHKLRKGVGSAIACENRNNRLLQPLSSEDIPLNLYPNALAHLAGKEEDVMFAALKKTLASILVANSGTRKRRRRESHFSVVPVQIALKQKTCLS